VQLYAGRDDFKDSEDLKAKLSRARPKDSILDYAQHRGVEATRAHNAEQERPAPRSQPEPSGRSGRRESWATSASRKPGGAIPSPASSGKGLDSVAGLADFDPQAKARSAELRDEMKRASQEIARDPARMRAAEREGFAPRSDQNLLEHEPSSEVLRIIQLPQSGLVQRPLCPAITLPYQSAGRACKTILS
jgi:hypothetical protein